MSGPWTVSLGSDAEGNDVTQDLSKAPHVLLCGTSGSGKSVGLNALIVGLLASGTPRDTQITVLDPKRVEFGIYSRAPHVARIVTRRADMVAALHGLVTEMDRRYAAMERGGIVDIKEWHGTASQLPRLFLVCDELADLTMKSRVKAENLAAADVLAGLTRIAQLGRAAGVHLLVATQRPAADTLPGNLRANLGSRWAFRVRTRSESRIALDAPGAEALGQSPGTSLVSWRGATGTYCQGRYVSREDIAAAVDAAVAQYGATGARRAPSGAGGSQAALGRFLALSAPMRWVVLLAGLATMVCFMAWVAG